MPSFASPRATTQLGALTINSISLHIAGCWNFIDVDQLWVPNAIKGDNLDISGAPGTRALPYDYDESLYVLPGVIGSRRDRTGALHTSVRLGLRLNIKEFEAQIVQPPTAPTAVYAASLTTPDADTLTADVQVTGFTHKIRGGFADCALTIRVPERFV